METIVSISAPLWVWGVLALVVLFIGAIIGTIIDYIHDKGSKENEDKYVERLEGDPCGRLGVVRGGRGAYSSREIHERME